MIVDGFVEPVFEIKGCGPVQVNQGTLIPAEMPFQRGIEIGNGRIVAFQGHGAVSLLSQSDALAIIDG